MHTRHVPNCYLCGSAGEIIHEDVEDRVFSTMGKWSFRACNNSQCGLVWLDPLVIKEDVAQLYRSYYTHESLDKTIANVGFVRWLVYRSYWLLNSAIFGLVSFIMGMKQDQYIYLKKIKPGRLLEIGPGTGNFLGEMKKKGWAVEGVEIDEEAAKAAAKKHNITIHTGDLVAVKYPVGSFDLIVMIHLVEHLYDQKELFNECYRLLAPGGKILVVTPNINSWGHRTFGRNWRGLEPPRHIHLFSQQTLKQCAQSCGFTGIETSTSAINAIVPLLGSLNIRDIGKHQVGGKRTILSGAKALLMQYYELLLMIFDRDLGEELIMFAEKEGANR